MTATKFHTFVLHERPHFDEIVGQWLFRMGFGEKLFPGSTNANDVIFWPAGGETPDGRSPEEWERDGYIMIGVGGGRFDEHPPKGGNRKKGCAATLVAEALGIANDPALQQILKFALNSDCGPVQPFSLASITKLLHEWYSPNPDFCIEWVIIALNAKYKEQARFHNETKEEFERYAQIEIFTGPRGQDITLVTVSSSDSNINKYARYLGGANADVVIQRLQTGHTQIYTARRAQLRLHEVVAMLRVEEQRQAGKILTSDWVELQKEGIVAGAEAWWYHKDGEQIFNGSLTNAKVQPTKLALSRIKKIVRSALDLRTFEPSRQSQCALGVCTASIKNLCPWHAYGLARCRAARKNRYRQ